MTINWQTKSIKIKDLIDYEHNPRNMSKIDFNNLVRSLKEDGYHQKLLVNTTNVILGGHARRRALLESGLTIDDEIEVLMPDRELSNEEFQRINIRDNLEYGKFDFDILNSHFDTNELIEWGMSEDMLTGFGAVDEEAEEKKEKDKKQKSCPHCGELL